MGMAAAPRSLREIALFDGLEADELARVNRLLSRRTVPAGSVVITVDQPGEFAYVVAEGTLKIQLEPEEGGAVVLALLGPGEVVGEMSLVDSLGRSASVVAQEPAVLFGIDRASFWECLRTMGPMACNLARILSRRLRLANTQIESLASMDVAGRVARQLLAFAREYGEPAPDGGTRIPLRLTQGDVAGMVGASRVRVNQVFVAWKRRRAISVDARHRITLHDAAALAGAERGVPTGPGPGLPLSGTTPVMDLAADQGPAM